MTKYDLFLSYNSKDCDEIERIRTQLGQLPQPLNTFIDRETLTLGKSWFEEIQEALINSRAVAVFYGKNGLGRWQNREMILAMDQQATTNKDDNRTLVIPVLLPGADLENAPRFLLINTFLDLRSPDSLKNLQRFADTVLKQDTLPHAAITLDSLPPRDALRNPYRGLDFFREEDAPLFFGRDEIAQKLLVKIKTCSLVALVGNSGTGKSSVMRAGLIPLLRKQHAPDLSWEVIVCIPGVNPFQTLASALLESWNYAPADVFKECPEIENRLRKTLSLVVGISQTLKTSQNADKLLLVIDQFEELITLEKQGAEKQKSDFELFVELLLNAIKATNCKVLLTIRGDYYGTVTERHSGLAEVIEKGTVTLKRLEDKQLREIIEEPAKLGGGKFEKGLAERIIDDVEKQPGNLALLEFALTLLWNSKNDSLLTHEAYEKKVGKLEGAISNKADEILKSSDVGNPQLALMALTRLVRVSSNVEDGGDTRQRVPLKEFNPAERACLEPFVKARLLVASGSWHESDDQALEPDTQVNHKLGPTLEVAHDALIRHWPTLQEALKDKRELLIWRQTIRPQYESWQQLNKTGGKPEELEAVLLQGFPLKQALKWLCNRPQDLTGDEPKFIRLSETFEDKRELLIWRKTIRPQYEKWQKLCNTDGNTKVLDAFLLKGFLLEQGLTWLNERPNDLIGDEPNFILLSREKVHKQQRLFRRLKRAGMAVLPVLLMAITSLGLAAYEKTSFSIQLANLQSWLFDLPIAWLRAQANWIPEPKMISIPAGKLTLAKDKQVDIKAFRIGQYELTFAEYDIFVFANKENKSTSINSNEETNPQNECYEFSADLGWGRGSRPAINVSWGCAQQYYSGLMTD